MFKRFLLIMAALLFCSSVFAISAQDAINFATKQNNFFYPGETVEIFPNTSIRSQGKSYWVITALSGDSLTGFVPVLDKANPGLPDSVIATRNLIKTAYALRNQVQLSEASSQQGTWLFDAKNVKFFSDLSQDLKNERIDLTTVKASLGGFPQLQDDADSLIAALNEMHPVASDISDALSEAASFESSFVAGPDTNKLNLFERKFQDGFGLIQDLEEKRLDYLAELDILRQLIASTGLVLETKRGLNSLANVPTSLQQFGSKATTAVDLEEKLSQIFGNAQTNVDNLAAGLSTREERNAAFQALYARDSEIVEKAGQNSLEQLFGMLLADEYFFRWENQSDLANAKENWEKAVAFYESGSFKQAEQYAARAKRPALRVAEAGLKSEPPAIDFNLLFGVIVLLIIALIAIYALRNRDKIAGLVGAKEEIEASDWSE